MYRKRALGILSALAIAVALVAYTTPKEARAQASPPPSYPQTINFPHSTNTAGPQATASADALGIVCQYNASAPTLTNLSLGVCQMDVNGNIKIAGTFSATVTYPYSGTSSGQAATTQSFLGSGCIYNSSLPTITSAQFAPCQAGVHGEQLFSGLGTAGTPVGGVVSVQGVSGGTAIPVTGSFSTVFPYGPTPGPTTAASSGIGVNGCYVAAGVTLTNGQQACLQVNSAGALITTGGGGSTFPYGPTPGPTTAAASSVGISGCYVAAGVSLTNGQQVCLQVDSAGNLHTVGTTANLTLPYSGTAGPQTATGASFLGVGCIYNTSTPAPTNGQYVQAQCDNQGNVKVAPQATVAPFIPIGVNPSSTPTPAAFDANNNLVTFSNGQTFTGTLGALNATLTIPFGAYNVISFQPSGTWTGSVSISGSSDGSTYSWAGANSANPNCYTSGTGSGLNFSVNTYALTCIGYGLQTLQLKMTSYTSGTLTVTGHVGGSAPAINTLTGGNPASSIGFNNDNISTNSNGAAVGSMTLLYGNPNVQRAYSTQAYGATSNEIGINATGSICNSSALISAVGSTATQLVALAAGKVIEICGISTTVTTAGTVTITAGTGTNCNTGTVTLLPAMTLAVGTPWVVPPLSPFTRSPASDAVCIAFSAGTGSGVLTYGQY